MYDESKSKRNDSVCGFLLGDVRSPCFSAKARCGFGIAEEFLTDQEYEDSYCEWPLREYHHKAEWSKKRKTKKSDDESVRSTRPGC